MSMFRRRWVRVGGWMCVMVAVLGLLMCVYRSRPQLVRISSQLEEDHQQLQQCVDSVQPQGVEKTQQHKVDDKNLVTPKHGALSSQKNWNGSAPFVFYNRVPKCGSSSTRQLIEQLSDLNNFTFVQARIYMKFWLSASDQNLLVERIKSYSKPLIFERHLHFLNFKSFSMEQAVYINVIRDPIDRLASWYYFRRYQPGHIRDLPLADRIRSYDECVLGDHLECTSPGSSEPEEGFYKIIPFFCGQEAYCREPSERSLLGAIENVRRHYLVVGLLERYDDFLRVLERLLPGYFTGATGVYNNTHGAIKHETRYRLPVSEEARAAMRSRMSLDYQFYDFVTRRFKKQVRMVLNSP